MNERRYVTHAFRPIIGNSQFCSACPPRESYGETHPRHVGHEPISLDQAKLETSFIAECPACGFQQLGYQRSPSRPCESCHEFFNATPMRPEA